MGGRETQRDEECVYDTCTELVIDCGASMSCVVPRGHVSESCTAGFTATSMLRGPVMTRAESDDRGEVVHVQPTSYIIDRSDRPTDRPTDGRTGG